jgi:hypothetical protein
MDSTAEHALAYLEQHKILDETTQTYTVSLTHAIEAVRLAMDAQLEQALTGLEDFQESLAQSIRELGQE